MRTRVIAVGVIENLKGEFLVCKSPEDRGVYPGQWFIPGGGIEEGETMEEGLRREMREELGIELDRVEPWYFKDAERVKIKPGRKPEKVYMIYLLFRCWVGEVKIESNEEVEEYAWVKLPQVFEYDLNEATKETFERLVKEVGQGELKILRGGKDGK